MATKSMARTVIEGGRYRYNKFERRYSNRVVRRRANEYARRMCDDPDEFDGAPITLRQPVYKGFFDKLGPAQRWLASQVGQPWDEVHSEIKRRFDVRTIAGQHIVFDHLLRWVDTGGSTRWSWYGFFVDDQGDLQRRPRPARGR